MNVDGDTLYREFCQRIGEEEGGEALLRYSKARYLPVRVDTDSATGAAA